MTYRAKKKKNLGNKILIWFLLFAMASSFIATIAYYLIAAK